MDLRICCILLLYCRNVLATVVQALPDTMPPVTEKDMPMITVQNSRTFKFESTTSGFRKLQDRRQFQQTKSPSIVFPDSYDEEDNNDLKQEETFSNCDGTICERVNNYPTDLLKDILKKATSKPRQAEKDILYVDEIGIKNRIGTNEESLCSSVETVIYPQGGINKNGSWTLIANFNGTNDLKYEQGIRVEKCTHPDRPCSYADRFPPGQYPKCKQKYIYRKLIALNKDKKLLYPDHILIPSCCSCTVFKTNILERRANPEVLALTTSSTDDMK